jgi:transcriptional regulator with XRE-family HTH domain
MNRAERDAVAVAFGAVLCTARHGAGLTQEELAGEAGLDRTYPRLLERGMRTPTITVLMRIGEVLSVDPRYCYA